MELKGYQQRVLDTFDVYLDELGQQRKRALQIEELSHANPGLNLPAPDYPAETWAIMKQQGRLPKVREHVPFSPRKDGTGRTVPNVCFKIPTGGGKTLLAVEAVSRLFGKYLASNTGLVLWIVPNEAIYTQTKKQLTNREHPYRQRLERTAAGKVKILEKEDRLNRRDLDTHLCIMLLMLQSANRDSKETLKLFRDRGNVHGFFPHEDDFGTHFKLLEQIPNLTAYGDRNRKGAIVQDSLGNVLRLIRPVVIMDEGHKAYSTQAIKTVYDFNPCFVLELSATPRDRQGIYSNWLVDVRGTDLDREEMIKLPINVKVRAGDDWRGCLKDSVDCLNKGLHQAAEALQADTNRYI